MKIGINVRTEDYSRAVKRKARDGSIKSLGHAGAVIRLIARRSIRKRKGRSQPGTAPHSRQGALRRAIVYAVEARSERVVIGPDYYPLRSRFDRIDDGAAQGALSRMWGRSWLRTALTLADAPARYEANHCACVAKALDASIPGLALDGTAVVFGSYVDSDLHRWVLNVKVSKLVNCLNCSMCSCA